MSKTAFNFSRHIIELKFLEIMITPFFTSFTWTKRFQDAVNIVSLKKQCFYMDIVFNISFTIYTSWLLCVSLAPEPTPAYFLIDKPLGTNGLRWIIPQL